MCIQIFERSTYEFIYFTFKVNNNESTNLIIIMNFYIHLMNLK